MTRGKMEKAIDREALRLAVYVLQHSCSVSGEPCIKDCDDCSMRGWKAKKCLSLVEEHFRKLAKEKIAKDNKK